MATPTNPELVRTLELLTELSSRPAPAGTELELWQVTTSVAVKKGTDVEKLMADILSGRAVGPADQTVQGPIAVTDLTKLK